MPGLFDPITIKNLTIKNRIVLAPMNTRMAGDDGEVNDRHIRHYLARARANVGLIIVEYTFVEPRGRHLNSQLGASEDRHIPGLRRLAEAIRGAGAVAALQLCHAGPRATNDVIGEQPLSPSGRQGLGIPGIRELSEPPRILTEDEIGELASAFADSAGRAVEAGFDLVELHGAHGFLLSQFLSPLTNARNDSYGGDASRRLAFPRQVVSAMRKRIGPDFPLFYRLGADDFLPGGLTAADGQQAALALVEAGADVIDVSGGLTGSGRDRLTEQGFFVSLAEGVRKVAKAPVIGVGNIREPEYADRVVREERIDLVAIGRALLSDPLWAQKAAERLGVNSDWAGK
ncbi:MAG: NADH:flavin oxidoreductase [Dehalococcoidia bacterium]|nr:NADH:flavin oxidoreductase [Dehalococcoidia bacterium]